MNLYNYIDTKSSFADVRNKPTYKRRVEIDVIYADNYCLLMDLRIILRTIGVIFFPKDNDEYY